MEELDPRLVEYLKTHCGPHCYGEQDENGVDLSLIKSNLELTPLERIRRGDRARRQAEMLLEAGRKHRERSVRNDH